MILVLKFNNNYRKIDLVRVIRKNQKVARKKKGERSLQSMKNLCVILI